MPDVNAHEIWKNAWKQEIHTTDYALKRIKSAQSAKLTPIRIDATDFYGHFQGSHGRYETFLDYCPCGDFRRSHLPCKHIYRLAIELGLIDIKTESSQNAIVTPKNECVSLSDTIDIVESLSTDAQLTLLNIASNIRSTTPVCEVDFNNIISELISCGIIIDTAPNNHKINFKTKKDIIKLLDTENIPYNKNSKKCELEEICIQCIPQKATETFGTTVCVSIPTQYSSRNIHYYLHRKYDSETYYDENLNCFHEVKLLDTTLPDDAITDQLRLRGYYLQLVRQDANVDEIQISVTFTSPTPDPAPTSVSVASSVPSVKDITLDPSKEYLWTKWGVYEMPEPYTINPNKGPRNDLVLIATV